MRSGSTSEPGWRAEAPCSRSSTTSESTSRPPGPSKSRTTTRAFTPAAPRGRGTSTIVRAGCRSSSPASTLCALASHSGGAQTTCVIVLARSSGTGSSCSRQRASTSRRSTSSTTLNRHAPPRAAVAVEQLVGRARAPASGRVVGERRTVTLPRADDRVDELPLLVDLVLAGEERRVAEHRVEDQPLVRLGEALAEGAAVEEVHVHRADRHAGARHLGADRERDALVGLDVDEEDVGTQPVAGDRLEGRMRRALELDRDRRLAPGEPLAGPDVERRVRPAPVVDVELRRDERLGERLRRDAVLLAVGAHLLRPRSSRGRTDRGRPTSAPACGATAAPSPSPSAPRRP